jgi:hypothetical protein
MFNRSQRFMEKVEKILEKYKRPLFPPFYGASQRRLLLRGELLRRDKDKRKRKKRLIRLQVHPHRDFLTGIITLVSLYLWGSAGVGSSDLFATQQDDLCVQLHGVYPGRYSCGSVAVSLYL